MNIIDISKGILTAKVYPGDPEPVAEKVLDMEKGDAINLTKLTACVHAGTHADAPSHFVADGATIDKLALEHFIGKCLVVTADSVVDKHLADSIDMGDCRILLVRGNAYLAANAAEVLAKKGVITVGTETMSVGARGSEKEVHEALFLKDIAVIENLDLQKVLDGEYILAAPPIKIENSEGAFVRAALIEL